MRAHIGEGCFALMALAPAVGASGTAGGSATPPAGSGETAAFTLPALPYAQDALEPCISAKTMSFHYGKHHATYVENLNKLVANTPRSKQSLETIIRETAGVTDSAAVFNNAAQIWNHTFFWNSMKAGGGKPAGHLLEQIVKTFGSFEDFKTAFVAAGVAQFGSGWVWLVQEGDALRIVKTSNADTPLAHNQKPLLTCDVWEHAYYLDYQNRRKDFIQAFLDHLANWDFAAAKFK